MDGMDKFHSDMAAINARVDQLIRERAEMAELLERIVTAATAFVAEHKTAESPLITEARALLAKVEGK